MAITYTPIATVTVGSGGASSIEFTSISSSYTDLVLRYSLRGDYASTITYAIIEFNGLSTNRTALLVGGNGSSAFSSSYGSDIFSIGTGSNATASTFGNGEIYIPNYAASVRKCMNIDGVTENNDTSASIHLLAGLWSSTSAITAIRLFAGDNTLAKNKNWVQYSTATLYGILKA